MFHLTNIRTLIVILLCILQDGNILSQLCYKKDDKLYFSSEDSLYFNNVIYALQKLAIRLRENSSFPPSNITIFEGKFETEITPFLTDRMRELLLKGCLTYDGPNCWNAVLYFLKIVSYIGFGFEDEFRFYLEESGFFTQLPADDTLEPGDVGVIVKKQTKEIRHAFIYLYNNIIIDKIGYQANQPYQIASLEEQLKSYNDYEILNFRCVSPAEIKKKLVPIRKYLKEIDNLGLRINLNEDIYLKNQKLNDMQDLLILFLKQDREILSLLSTLQPILSKILCFTWKSLAKQLVYMTRYLESSKFSIESESGKIYEGEFCGIFFNENINERIIILSHEKNILKLRTIKLNLDTLNIQD